MGSNVDPKAMRVQMVNVEVEAEWWPSIEVALTLAGRCFELLLVYAQVILQKSRARRVNMVG